MNANFNLIENCLKNKINIEKRFKQFWLKQLIFIYTAYYDKKKNIDYRSKES